MKIITPDYRTLLNKDGVELNSVLADLNSPSMKKLVRELLEVIKDHKTEIQVIEKEKVFLDRKLDEVIGIATKISA